MISRKYKGVCEVLSRGELELHTTYNTPLSRSYVAVPKDPLLYAIFCGSQLKYSMKFILDYTELTSKEMYSRVYECNYYCDHLLPE